MKAWIRALLWTLLSRPIIQAVGWTEAEQKQFEVFYNSSCGRRLFELLRQTAASTTFNAVYASSVSANAYARGMQDMLLLIHRLRSFPPDEQGSEFAGDEDIEPLPSQKSAIDGRRFGLSGGNSAIR
jgi:hypothetical protein